MRTVLAVFLDWVHQITLSLWLGGAVVLGAIGAPGIFQAARDRGDTGWGMPFWDFAGVAAGIGFGRFNYLVLTAGAIMLAAGLVQSRIAGLCKRRSNVRAILTAIAWCVALWLTVVAFPQMQHARLQGDRATVDNLHHVYSGAYWAQMILLMTVAALTGWMHLDRRQES